MMSNNYYVAGLSTNAGEACHYLSRYDDAIRYAEQCVGCEEPVCLPYALTVIGMASQALGRLDEAAHRLDEAKKMAHSTGDRYAEAAAWRALGDLAAAQNQRDRARSAYEQSLALYVALGNEVEIMTLRTRLAILGRQQKGMK